MWCDINWPLMGTNSESETNELLRVASLEDENEALVRIGLAMDAENALKRKLEEPLLAANKQVRPSKNNNLQNQLINKDNPQTNMSFIGRDMSQNNNFNENYISQTTTQCSENYITQTTTPFNESYITQATTPPDEHYIPQTPTLSNDGYPSQTATPVEENYISQTTTQVNESYIPQTPSLSNQGYISQTTTSFDENYISQSTPHLNENYISQTPTSNEEYISQTTRLFNENSIPQSSSYSNVIPQTRAPLEERYLAQENQSFNNNNQTNIPASYNENIDMENTNKNNRGTNNTNYTPLNEKCRNNYYIPSDKGPFVIYIEHKNKEQIHAMSIGKLIRDYSFNIYKDIITIQKIMKYRIKVIIKSYENANCIIRSTIWEAKNLIAFVPNFSISRPGVVRDIDVALNEEDIIYYAESEQQILKARRISKKDRNTQNRIRTPVVILTFRGQTLPREIRILGVNCKVEAFIQKVVQCFSCLRYGHIAENCISERRCERCGQKHEYSFENCLAPFYCVHCGNNHKSTDSENCSEYAIQTEIKKIMASRNLPFLEAKQVLQKEIENKNDNPTYADKVASAPPVPAKAPAQSFSQNTGISITNKPINLNSGSKIRKPPPLKVQRNPNFETPKNDSNELNIPKAPILNTTQYRQNNNSNFTSSKNTIVNEKENLIKYVFNIILSILSSEPVKNNEITSNNIYEMISTAINSYVNNIVDNNPAN